MVRWKVRGSRILSISFSGNRSPTWSMTRDGVTHSSCWRAAWVFLRRRFCEQDRPCSRRSRPQGAPSAARSERLECENPLVGWRQKWDGDLQEALRLPIRQATRALSRFPMIGKPGAERILLLTGTHPILALDSNGLRVLVRLGYGEEGKRYEKTYESVRASTAAEERPDIEWVTSLHWLLRRHGKEVCRRRDCARCPLTKGCAYYDEHLSSS